MNKGRGHFIVSIIKSLLRIGGCLAAWIVAYSNPQAGVIVLAGSLCGAEVLGVLEEVLDKRE